MIDDVQPMLRPAIHQVVEDIVRLLSFEAIGQVELTPLENQDIQMIAARLSHHAVFLHFGLVDPLLDELEQGVGEGDVRQIAQQEVIEVCVDAQGETEAVSLVLEV